MRQQRQQAAGVLVLHLHVDEGGLAGAGGEGQQAGQGQQ
jgi:hypothetical protein